jgi:hypothetical protein
MPMSGGEDGAVVGVFESGEEDLSLIVEVRNIRIAILGYMGRMV